MVNVTSLDGVASQLMVFKQIQNFYKVVDNLEELSLEEKARRYDEIQRWWWWADRRARNNAISKLHWLTFLNGIKEHLQPYKEQEERQ